MTQAVEQRGPRRAPGRAAPFVRHLFLVSLAVAGLFPFYYLFVNSLKDRLAFAQNQLSVPSDLVWSNYAKAWDALAKPVFNSIVVVGGSVVLILVLSALASYAFAILRFPGWRAVYWLVFVLLLIPSFLLLLPLYLQITRLPVKGGYLSIILPTVAAALAFSIVVLKSFFEQIPQELLDAARVDGAGDLTIFWRIVVPLSRPVLTSVAIIQCVALWNDYLLPQLVLDPAYRTVSVAMVAFTANPGQASAPDYGAIMAGYVVSAVPLVILFAFMMRAYIDGLTSGAGKL